MASLALVADPVGECGRDANLQEGLVARVHADVLPAPQRSQQASWVKG